MNGGLRASEMVAVAAWSTIGKSFAFEITTTAKGGKVYKFAAESEEDCDSWMQAIDAVILAGLMGGGAAPALAASGGLGAVVQAWKRAQSVSAAYFDEILKVRKTPSWPRSWANFSLF